MCQVDDGDLVMRKDAPRLRKAESRNECVKCGSGDVVIPHGGHAALCRDCFLGNINHKFRATVAKSQALRQGESVLLAYSGGVASGAMLSLVAEGVEEGTAKKLRFRPGCVLHVDETAAISTTHSGDRLSSTEESSCAEDEVRWRTKFESLRRLTREIFEHGRQGQQEQQQEQPSESRGDANNGRVPPCYVAPVENVMAIDDDGDDDDSFLPLDAEDGVDVAHRRRRRRQPSLSELGVVDVNGPRGVDDYLDLMRKKSTIENRRRLKTFLDGLKSPTSRIRAAELLRRKLISRLAAELGYAHVMEGVSASRVAIEIMTDLALGRGTQIPKDVGLIDDRFYANDRVTVVRPLREFSNKEIVVYVSLAKIPATVTENMETGTSPMSSIQRATEHFILGLQNDFSSTVSTVCRTGEKLAANQLKQDATMSTEGSGRCCLCNTVLDVPEAPQRESELLREITSPSTTSECSYATAARALDVTTFISRASSNVESSSSGAVDSDDVELELDPDVTPPPRLHVISRALCYSCRLIPRELSDRGTAQSRSPDSRAADRDTHLEHLPAFVLQDAVERENRNVMREKIKDFLLDDT